jgi:hypothetical protein
VYRDQRQLLSVPLSKRCIAQAEIDLRDNQKIRWSSKVIEHQPASDDSEIALTGFVRNQAIADSRRRALSSQPSVAPNTASNRTAYGRACAGQGQSVHCKLRNAVLTYDQQLGRDLF